MRTFTSSNQRDTQTPEAQNASEIYGKSSRSIMDTKYKQICIKLALDDLDNRNFSSARRHLQDASNAPIHNPERSYVNPMTEDEKKNVRLVNLAVVAFQGGNYGLAYEFLKKASPIDEASKIIAEKTKPFVYRTDMPASNDDLDEGIPRLSA